jgi:hypothetical protein
MTDLSEWLWEIHLIPPFAMKPRRVGHPELWLIEKMQVPPLRFHPSAQVRAPGTPALRYGRDDNFMQRLTLLFADYLD